MVSVKIYLKLGFDEKIFIKTYIKRASLKYQLIIRGKLMRIILFSLALVSLNLLADGHEANESSDNQYMLLSTYEIASGQNPADLEKELVQLQLDQESYGFNDCGLYQHWYGGERAFYAYCYFSDFDQFESIRLKSEADDDRMAITQNYSNHTDHILELQKANLINAPDNLLWMKWKFGPYLTIIERQERVETLFDAFNRSFGGCSLYNHSWGPEIAHYMSCGFENFSDFGKKHDAINKILGEELATAKLDILEHSDDLLTLIQD